MHELRKIASQGIPDGAGIRSTVWKVCVYVCKVTIFGFRFCLVLEKMWESKFIVYFFIFYFFYA